MNKKMHNYFTNYYTSTYFDIIVSSSGRLLPENDTILSKHVEVDNL
jgi:hypothetical protein